MTQLAVAVDVLLLLSVCLHGVILNSVTLPYILLGMWFVNFPVPTTDWCLKRKREQLMN